MKDLIKKLAGQKMKLMAWNKPYRKLQKHLNKMPVGYPATFSGVELRLLKTMFTIEEAEFTLNLNYKPETLDSIWSRIQPTDTSKETVKRLLDGLAGKGTISSVERGGEMHFFLSPLVDGMFEHQLKTLTPSFMLELREYFFKKFGIEFLSSRPGQFRVIPVEKSITPENHVAAYDEIKEIIRKRDGQIAIADCICKKGKDLLNEPCKATDRREICMLFGEHHDMYTRHKWGRTISKDEAIEIMAQSEKEGLVPIAHNEQDTIAICACCSCCCGLIDIFGTMPGPSDFITSSFKVKLDSEKCNGCTKCEQRCQFDAITIEDKKAVVKDRRCVGCGLCVSACKKEALMLVKKNNPPVPPATKDDLFDEINRNKGFRLVRFSRFLMKMLKSAA